MRQILILFLLSTLSVTLMAQTKPNFPALWKEVQKFENSGLTKSAQEKVNEIYQLAIKEKNEAQQIKSALYLMKYNNVLTEESEVSNLAKIDSLIATSSGATKSIWYSIKGQFLSEYYNNSLYFINQRTALAANEKETILTWSGNKFRDEIAIALDLSIKEKDVLQETHLNEYNDIITKGTGETLRPTLYDLLAHRALNHYENLALEKVGVHSFFKLTEANAFATPPVFINTTFPTPDSNLFIFKSLEIYKALLSFHLNGSTEALFDVDLNRLMYVHSHSTHEHKDSLYIAALQNIVTQSKSPEVKAEAEFRIASLYYNQERFNTNEESKGLRKSAELLKATFDKYSHTEAGKKSYNLLEQIKRPSLSLKIEHGVVPNQTFLSLVNYKNLNEIHLRVVPYTYEDYQRVERLSYPDNWKAYTKMEPLHAWTQTLVNPVDYISHKTQIKIDALKPGTYLLLASASGDFNTTDNILTATIVYVSRITYIKDNAGKHYVLNRETGFPIQNATVKVLENYYDKKSRNNKDRVIKTLTTDANGFFVIDVEKNMSYKLSIKHENDEYFIFDKQEYYYFSNYVDNISNQMMLFTDRSIYRPGQTVFFKGIAIQTDTISKTKKAYAGLNGKVQLKDPNSRTIHEIEYTTNEFGSFHGSFTIPESGLTGLFSLSDSSLQSYQHFSVEEYKRPTYKPELEQPTETYKLNDSIHVKGKVLAYAGNAINGAKVSYRVTRTISRPIYRYMQKSYFPPSIYNPIEVDNGFLTTADDGSFTISFKAFPGETIDKHLVYTFNIITDVTDNTGETRSTNLNIPISSVALHLIPNGETNISQDELSKITVFAQNINGIPQPTLLEIKVSALQSPGKLFKERLWEEPDQFVMSKPEFEKQFPSDVYKNENDPSTWAVKNVVMDFRDSSNATGKIKWPAKKLSEGWHLIQFKATGGDGETVEAVYNIYITQEKSTLLPIVVKAPKQTANPGEQVKVNLQSAFDKVWAIQTVNRMDKKQSRTFHTISQNLLQTLTVTEEDRGGIFIGHIFVKNNRIYQGGADISVPWDNKKLTLSYETFRDNLLPGAEETFTINVKGDDAKAKAELLINMYDASLDQFKPHNWSELNSIWPSLQSRSYWNLDQSFSSSENYYNKTLKSKQTKSITYPYIRYMEIGQGRLYNFEYRDDSRANLQSVVVTGVSKRKESNKKIASAPAMEYEADFDKKMEEVVEETPTQEPQPTLRTNFNETAFFFPEIYTDKSGNVSFQFKMPDALTKWKLMSLAHTPDLKSAYQEAFVTTSKPLMVQPNLPRFFRESDKIELPVKIANLTDSSLTGTVQIELINAVDGKLVDGWFQNVFPTQHFTSVAQQSSVVFFPISIPANFNSALTVRIKAITKDGVYSDGEEKTIPVVINRTLVTETLPFTVRNEKSKLITFSALLNSGSSGSLKHHKLTVEVTSNPVWQAVQALPYLMEYPYECSEQIFSRYYANLLASYITSEIPKIKQVFDQWKTISPDALLSNLEKNQELKSALLEETPWVLEGNNESLQKQKIAMLFDLTNIAKESEKSLRKLAGLQNPDGSFSWFKGGPANQFITQHIALGLGKLKSLNAFDNNNQIANTIILESITYLDEQIVRNFENIKKNKKYLTENHLSSYAIQYLYMRSFHQNIPMNDKTQAAAKYFLSQEAKYWKNQSIYLQGMIVSTLNKNGDNKTAQNIIKALKQNAIRSNELGMYWKSMNVRGHYWTEAPIETISMLISAFHEINPNDEDIQSMKFWLLRNKQTNHWKTTIATTDACYALLKTGTYNLDNNHEVNVKLGNLKINSIDETKEPGTGYFKKSISGEQVTQGMGNIEINVSNANASTLIFGGVYWQYFEDLDKIKTATSPLSLEKKYFIQTNTANGPILTEVQDKNTLKVGDRIVVRVILKTDRDMDFVHLKDMRPSGTEPANVLSGFKYNNGLGYYESTKDLASHFFIDNLSKGTYVFEYTVFATHSGNFSSGISTIQCMYAPEFSSHSNGIRMLIEEMN